MEARRPRPSRAERWRTPTPRSAAALITSSNSAIPGDERAIELLVDAGRDAALRAPEAAGGWLLAATRLLAGPDNEQRRLSLLAEASSALTFAG